MLFIWFHIFFSAKNDPRHYNPRVVFLGQGSVRRFRGPSRMLRNSFAWPSPQCLGQRLLVKIEDVQKREARGWKFKWYYAYKLYVYAIYLLYIWFVSKFCYPKSTGLEVELEKTDKLIHSSEGPRDLVTKKPNKISDIDKQGAGYYPAMFSNYEVVEVLHTI